MTRRVAGSAVVALLLFAGCLSRIEPPPALRDETPSLFARSTPDAIRFLSLNVGQSSIFPGAQATRAPGVRGRPQRLARIVRASSPDIFCLQEIHRPFVGAQVGVLLDSLLPLPGDERWQTHQVHDNVIASRFRIAGTAGVDRDYGSGTPRGEAIAALEVPSAGATRTVVVICAHFQSAGGERNIRARQRHANHIVDWLQTSLPDVGVATPPDSTAIVLLGDLNAYDTDPALHVETLLQGRSSGAADGTPPLLTDARPLHNGRGPDFYTWRADAQRFNPGALDRVLFNERRFERGKALVVNTLTMTREELSRAGLHPVDVMMDINERVHDHLPLVVDLRFR